MQRDRPDLVPSPLSRRQFLGGCCLMTAAASWGCGPDDAGTVTAPTPAATASLPSDKVTKVARKAPPGPRYDAIPRGPGQVQRRPD